MGGIKRRKRAISKKAKKVGGKAARERKRAVATAESGELRAPADVQPVICEVPDDAVRVREDISKMVRKSASEITLGVIEGAKAGQLASAKYLFEVAGVYPAAEGAEATRPEESLAYVLLKKMGLPTDPVMDEEGQVRAEVAERAGDATERTEVTPVERRVANSKNDDSEWQGFDDKCN